MTSHPPRIVFTQEINAGRKAVLPVPWGQTDICALGPRVHDPAYSCDFLFKPSEPREKWHSTDVAQRFILADLASGVDIQLVTLALYPTDEVEISVIGYPQIHFHSNTLFNDTSNRIDLAMYGSWCECSVNHQRLFLGLVPDNGRTMIPMFEVASMPGDLFNLSLKGLGLDPDPAKELLKAAPPKQAKKGTDDF